MRDISQHSASAADDIGGISQRFCLAGDCVLYFRPFSPTTQPQAFQPTCGGRCFYSRAFVTKLNASGSALVYATFLGGTSNEYPHSIAMDSSGNAYITGYTQSADFPRLMSLFLRQLNSLFSQPFAADSASATSISVVPTGFGLKNNH